MVDPLDVDVAPTPTADLQTIWASTQMQIEAHRPRAAATPEPVAAPVPVCLLTGFLGAGKSTLLAGLVTDPPDGIRIEALVNDVGALPFDPTLVEAADTFEVRLTNGCGCCEQIGAIAETLDELATTQPDLIVLEASGVADPLALAQVVHAAPLLELDRIVTVLSAVAADSQLTSPSLGPIVTRQLDAAHSVVITHGDRVSDDECRRVLAVVADRAPGRIITISGLDDPSYDVLLPARPRGAAPLPTGDSPDHALVTGSFDRPLDVGAERLARLFCDLRPGLVRAKGRIGLTEGPHAVQLTASSCSVRPSEGAPAGLTLVAGTSSDLERAIARLDALPGPGAPATPGQA